jgi:hypothetical protein
MTGLRARKDSAMLPVIRSVKANADHCHCQRVSPGEGLGKGTPKGEESISC